MANELNTERESSTARPQWPEDRPRRGQAGRLFQIFESWSYSYVNPILRKGRQQFKTGNHLTADDLFDVPDDMRAQVLASQFR